MSREPQYFLPLRPVELQILAALRTQDLHGYGILQETEAHAEGGGVPGLVTLYRALRRMEENGLVTRVEGSEGVGDERRRRYRITPLGRRVLRAEALRLSPLVRGALEGIEAPSEREGR